MRAIAGAMVLAFGVAGAASTNQAQDADRIAWERAAAAMAVAATTEPTDTNCGTSNARPTRREGDCAAEGASREEGATQADRRSTPVARPASGVCARNPETGRRKCSVRYLT